MFGRTDAPASDLAFFKANRLEPDRVYRVSNPVPPVRGPPTPTSWIDEIFQNRTCDRPQMREPQAAWRWLDGRAERRRSRSCPSRRSACSRSRRPGSRCRAAPTTGWPSASSNDAYRFLMIQETALLAGIPLTPENRPRISMITPTPERLMNRFRQRVTALNFAIQTTPPPQTEDGREELFELNLQLFQLYMSANFRDLARDRLKAALALNPETSHCLPRGASSSSQDQFNQLDESIDAGLGRRWRSWRSSTAAGRSTWRCSPGSRVPSAWRSPSSPRPSAAA